jgi:hypothetical protein
MPKRAARAGPETSCVLFSFLFLPGTTTFTGWLGSIRVRLPPWSGVEFDWPCFFRRNRPANLPPQLGLAGVLTDIRLLVDGTASPTAPHGILRVEQR